MVKLGSTFVRYDSTNSGSIITKVDSTPSTPIKSKSSFAFITSTNSLRDYVKRKIFKATKEEVSTLLKSTSNLNLAGVFSSKSSSSSSSSPKVKVPSGKKCKYHGKSLAIVNDGFEGNNQSTNDIDDDDQRNNLDVNKTEEGKVTLSVNESTRVQSVESSTEILDESMVEMVKPCRRFSLSRLSKRKKKKARFAEDLTQSLPVPGSVSTSIEPSVVIPCGGDSKSQPAIVRWTKKMRQCKSKSFDPLTNGKVSNDGQSGGDSKVNEEKVEPIKWTKRVRKFAIRTCRYLGYGAQMVSPLTPYTDIPMPVTYDGLYNVYPPYYGSDHYYSYSSCGSIYGYKMSHYGLTY